MRMVRRISVVLAITAGAFSVGASAAVIYQDNFDDDSLAGNTNGIGGGAISRTIEAASWADDGAATFVGNGSTDTQRALLYSENAFQSDSGFKLTVRYTTGAIANAGEHAFSFGLISSDAELSSYSGYNPFKSETSVYSLGVNLTEGDDVTAQGLNITDGTARTTLDQSGDSVQFLEGASTVVVIEVGMAGTWSYSINGVREASGMVPEGFDLRKSYRVAVYGRDEAGGGKFIQSLKLERRLALGERAEWMRGSWGICWLPEYFQNAAIEGVSIEPFLEQIKDYRTVDYIQVKLTGGSIYSPTHTAPHKLLESFWYDDGVDRDEQGEPTKDLVVPRWGDLSAEEPERDAFRDWLVAIKAAGMRTEVYVNSSNLLQRGDTPNPEAFGNITERWKAWCDSDPAAQAFIASQPYHINAYDPETGTYTAPGGDERKYIFCYVEFVLKEYAKRYGALIDAWCFDSANNYTEPNGDNAYSGILEEQRIYEAYANAVHAGNPNAAVAFNNSPNRDEGDMNPWSPATLFDDYMFGHPFGGNNDHASKTNGLYEKNYRFVAWMVATSGYVHRDDPDYPLEEQRYWDNKVVGHYYPKMAIQSWNGGAQAYEQEDFNEWNREMLRAGGAISWGLPLARSTFDNPYGPYLWGSDWAHQQLTLMDAHLSEAQFPGAPNWARAETILPEATIGQMYYHVLVEGVDLWDPEGDDIASVSLVDGGPSWLKIEEDPDAAGHWILTGIPDETEAMALRFSLRAEDGSEGRDREVQLVVNENPVDFSQAQAGDPVWAMDPLVIADAYTFHEYEYELIFGRDFLDFEGDALTLTKLSGPSWLRLEEQSSGRWKLSGTPSNSHIGLNVMQLGLSDGVNSALVSIELTVSDAQYLPLAFRSIEGGAHWSDLAPFVKNGDLTYNNSGNQNPKRALMYSRDAYQSDEGFRLTVNYTTGNVGDVAVHTFSFGLISSDTELSAYEGYNPFKTETNVYSLGVNITANGGAAGRGLNFANGSTATTLDQSGDNVQFLENVSTPVVIDIEPDGAWTYSINGVTEASGKIEDGFDLSKSYHVAVYGRDNEGGKSIQSIALELKSSPGLVRWLAGFPELGENVDLADDPDLDGQSTLLEYVLDGDPTSGDFDLLPVCELTEGDYVCEFIRRTESKTDVSQVFQYSTDLVEWEEISLTGTVGSEVRFVPVNGGKEELRITLGADKISEGRIFVRLRVAND